MMGWKARIRNERGATLILVAGSMVALLGFAALAVDVGNLVTIRTESQRAVDSAVLAGAGHLMIDPDDSLGAANKAIEYAALNNVNGSTAALLPGDVDVILDSMKVRAWLQNTSDRGNAPGTFFAKILGINTVNVVTTAAAWAAPANGIEPGGTIEDCLLPVGILDFSDINSDGNIDEGETPYGFTQEDDHGRLLKLAVSGSSTQGPPACQTEPVWDPITQDGVWNANPDVDYCNGPEDSWSCWFTEEKAVDNSATALGDAILGEYCATVAVGDTLNAATGESTSNVQASELEGGPGSFRDLIDRDMAESSGDDLVWCVNGEGGDSAVGCPMRASTNCSGTCVTESPRLRAAPILSPTILTEGGVNTTFEVTGIMGVFIDKVACNYSYPQLGGPGGQFNVYVRIMTAQTQGTQDGETPPDQNSLLRELKLIE